MPLQWPQAQDLHGHATNKLLCGLAVDCDGNTSICIKGELQAVQDLLLPILLSRAVNIIFIPETQCQRIRTYLYEISTLEIRTRVLQPWCSGQAKQPGLPPWASQISLLSPEEGFSKI